VTQFNASQRLLVLGLGAIGGSVALAAKSQRLFKSVVGYAQADDCQAALACSAVDVACSSLDQLVVELARADFIVLALPVKLSISTLAIVAQHIRPEAIVTDTCSVKGAVWQEVQRVFETNAAQFVGSHPIAGSHLSGFAGARGTLFSGALVTLGPGTGNALDRVREFWQLLGARVSLMTPDNHDTLYANVSHVPHMMAFGLANMLHDTLIHEATIKDHDAIKTLKGQVGKGFLDTTRIAASSPALWTEIALSNRQALLHSLNQLEQQMALLKTCLANQDEKALHSLIEKASQFRRQFDA
jgi:prephenate dehydrogenase